MYNLPLEIKPNPDTKEAETWPFVIVDANGKVIGKNQTEGSAQALKKSLEEDENEFQEEKKRLEAKKGDYRVQIKTPDAKHLIETFYFRTETVLEALNEAREIVLIRGGMILDYEVREGIGDGRFSECPHFEFKYKDYSPPSLFIWCEPDGDYDEPDGIDVSKIIEIDKWDSCCKNCRKKIKEKRYVVRIESMSELLAIMKKRDAIGFKVKESGVIDYPYEIQFQMPHWYYE